jgi:hypothetical protein
MAKAVTKLWYRIALLFPDGSRGLVAAEGEHLGDAIAAAEKHPKGSRALAVDVLADADIPLGESVGKERVVALGPLAAEAPALRWPLGVMPKLASTLPGPRCAFARHPGPTAGGVVLEAETDAEHLVDLYLGLIEKLPSANNLEVRVMDHFEAAEQTEIWLSKPTDAKSVLRFLDDHEEDFIANGHVELSVYLRAHKATLRLTEHKTVVFIADDRALEADVSTWMGELGCARMDKLTTIAAGPHFHYRPAGTRNRVKLAELLTRQRLRRVDVLRAPLTAG